MHIRSVGLENLRAFKNVSLDFAYPGRARDDGFEKSLSWPLRLPNVNVILGENGSGKSSLLDAIALAVLSPLIASSGYRPYSLIRRAAKAAPENARINVEIELHKTDRAKGGEFERLSALIERRGDLEFVVDAEPNKPVLEALFDDSSPAFFLVGYGATRRVEAVSASDLGVRRRSRALRYERVASLFEDHFALLPLIAWLPEWQERNPGRFKQVVNLVNRLTPEAIKFAAKVENGEYLFRHRGLEVPFGALSDGYRAYLGWISDLLYHLCMGAASGAKLVDSPGVVLVDEIDLHIHPAWQRTIIPTLAATLPNLQFIFTTHSPLVVGTLEAANLFSVLRGTDGFPLIERPNEETLGLTADQILRSEVFGLDSTRDPGFRADLLATRKDAEDGKKGAAVAFMRKAALGAGAEQVAQAEPPPTPDWLKKMAQKS